MRGDEGPIAQSPAKLGFWTCWSLTVGIMIGSGIFLLPSVLAPYGLLSFGGWALTAAGSMCLALVLARLASRTHHTGGVYVYAREGFGDLTGFLIAWGYWASYWIAIPAITIAFVGYLTVFIPPLTDNPGWQAASALAVIWALTLINLRGVGAAGAMQLIMTILKIIPLLAIIALGAVVGDSANLPAVNPQDAPFVSVLAATALLTMWAFSGMEAGAIPAGDVKNAEKTVPRAIVIGTLVVAFIYIASSYAVMRLVPAEALAQSTAPFADAAQRFGPWGPKLIAAGALISTAGAINGTIFVAGQMPMAVAIDGLAPKVFAQRTKSGAPALAIIIASALGSVLLLMNYTRGLVGAFSFLAMMSTLAILLPLFVSAAAELKHSWKNARSWTVLALLALVYSGFAILGSGFSILFWGGLFMALGAPVYFLVRER